MIVSVFQNVISAERLHWIVSLAGSIHFDDINLDKDYRREKSYRQSKLANVLFCRELAARLEGNVQSTECPISSVLLKNV